MQSGQLSLCYKLGVHMNPKLKKGTGSTEDFGRCGAAGSLCATNFRAMNNRNHTFRRYQPGEVVAITSLGDLGETAIDIIIAAKSIFEQGAVLVCGKSGLDTRTTEGKATIRVLLDILESVTGEEKPRKGRPGISHETINRARELRRTNKYTVQEICEKVGISRRAYYKHNCQKD